MRLWVETLPNHEAVEVEIEPCELRKIKAALESLDCEHSFGLSGRCTQCGARATIAEAKAK